MEALPPIRRESLHDRVAGHIQQAIANGYYGPGSRLPAENQLAQQLGVGRSSIREAIEHLVAIGLLTKRLGRGVFVSQPQDFAVRAMDRLVPALLLDRSSMRWLLEVRQVVEPRVAALASSRATEQDISDLDGIVRVLEEQRYNPDHYARTDLAFHRRVAQASGNLLFPRILKAIHSIFILELEMTVRIPGATDRSFSFHRSIFEAIKRGDAVSAERRMAEHLSDVEMQLIELKPVRRMGQTKSGASSGQSEGGEKWPATPRSRRPTPMERD